jgi:hypothetical protein
LLKMAARSYMFIRILPEKLWMKTLFKNLDSLFARRSARSREAKPFEFRPQCF